MTLTPHTADILIRSIHAEQERQGGRAVRVTDELVNDATGDEAMKVPWMHAKVVPYSSRVGSSVLLHDTEDGPVVAQLAFLNVQVEHGQNHRDQSESLAGIVAEAIEDWLPSSRLPHDDLCRLSRMFNEGADLSVARDRRINEWLKKLITEAAALDARRVLPSPGNRHSSVKGRG